MGRLSAVFIAFCMLLIAASAGIVAWLSLGFTGMEATVTAVAVLTALVMVNSVTGRQRDRSCRMLLERIVDSAERGMRDVDQLREDALAHLMELSSKAG